MKESMPLDNQSEQHPLSTYKPKPNTWHHAGWLPMIVTCIVGAIAFTFGIMYNNSTLKAKRAAEQAVIDLKNGVVRTEGQLKLVEEKSAIGLDEAIVMTIKNAKGTDAGLEVSVNTQNKLKGSIRNLDFTLMDIAQHTKETKAVEKAVDLGEIGVDSAKPDADAHLKKVHFQYTLGDSRQFLLYCKFTVDGLIGEKSLAVPFQLR